MTGGDERAKTVTEKSRKVGVPVKPPDGGWGWMVVLGSFMIHIITDGVTYSFGVFYDEFLTYFNEGKGPTAWILSILAGVTLCTGPISSLLVNIWGCRTVTIAGAVLASVCMALSVLAKSVYILYFTIGVGTGLGFGLIYLPAIVSVSMYFEKKRSLATGIAVCGSGFGTFIFAPIITKLLEWYGWKQSMLIISGWVMMCTSFGALFRPLPTAPGKPPVQCDDVFMTNNGDDVKQNKSLANFEAPSSSAPIRAWNSIEIINYRNSYGSIDYHKNPHFITSTKSESAAYTKQEQTVLKPPHVLYNKSIMHIPEYTQKTTEKRNIITTILHELFSFGLFKDMVFVLFIISNLLTSIGFNVPYVYMVSRAKSLGFTGDEAGMLLSVIGIANTIGRIVLGYLSDKPWVNRLYVYNVCLTLCGLATGLSCYCVQLYSLIIYAIVFGFTIGAYVGLTSVILVDLLGLEKLTNAFGLLLLFQGIGTLIGPPIVGELYDNLKSYNPGFYLAGVTMALSGVIPFFIPCIQSHRNRRAHTTLNNSDVF